MPNDYALPFFTKFEWIVLIFFSSWTFFYLWLIRGWKLSKRGWKIVDYIWLGFGAIGLMGSLENNRSEISDNLYSAAERRLGGALYTLQWSAHSGVGGGICRTFIKTEFSPPEPEFSILQKEYDDACTWFKQVIPVLPRELNKDSKLIKMESLPPRRIFHEEPIVGTLKHFEHAVSEVNDLLTHMQNILKNKERNEAENLIHYFGPVLLAIALGLRFTKVTAELRMP